MALIDRLESEMKEALRAGDQTRLSVIRLLRSTIKNKEIEKGKGRPLSEEELFQLVGSAIKQRREAIEQFSRGGRQDLVDKERRELEILQGYLPEPLSRAELLEKARSAIAEAGARDIRQMGSVMKILMPQVAGRAEGAEVSRVVKDLLEKRP
jgi:uncharacterized protein YqeY